MDAQERIIRRLFAEQYCHHCGSPYEEANIAVLARRSEVWMVMVSCIACEEKDTFVVKFPQETPGRRHVTSYRLSKPPSAPLREGLQRDLEVPPTPVPSTPVSVDDVLDMHEFLKYFDGDFQRLFAEIE